MPILAAEAPAPNKPTSSEKKVPHADMNGLGSVTRSIGGEWNSTIPILSLDCDTITDGLAAKLALSLIGHVLFLKSQVPLPVVQIMKISNTKSSAKALKQRNELLSSFDLLTSHLNTTFTSLSSALEKMRTSTDNKKNGSTHVGLNCGRVYMGVFVGSTTASAKAKVMFAVDGLEIKAIGARDDKRQLQKNTDDSNAVHQDVAVDEDVKSEGVEDEEESDEEDEEPETDEETDSESSPPPDSRSPSPEPSYPSHAEQQKALQAAERLLSRTLALADAEGNAPQQTYILLRAPRRFDHPAWIPRQNLSASMENTLNEFLEESGIRVTEPPNAKPRKTQKKSKAVEGVWVVGRSGLNMNIEKDEVYASASADEWDEMIWWNWDGKLAGFSDW
ncbi:hypothetical protein H0H92_005114 [Tricholoma furcatifolium]|nr:hypothetical protein H0H92_005114 [Tricholoma furcatifolium]